MSDKINVVIADDVVDTRENIKRLLSLEDDISVVGEAPNGDKAIKLAEDLQPDVILMDINMPVVDGITATETIHLKMPKVSIIIVSVQGEQEYLKKAMKAGARDYLVKPFSGDELVNTIRDVTEKEGKRMEKVLEENQAQKNAEIKPKIHTVFSAKGGSGKTTIAANLATSLAIRHKKNTVIVDLALQFGDVPLIFNIAPKQTIADLVSEIQDMDLDLIENFLVEHESGVKILPPPKGPEEAEYVNADHIEKILKVLSKGYEYIIIDTPPNLSEEVLKAFDLSHQITLLTTLELTSIKTTKKTLNIMGGLGYPKEKVKLIINKGAGYYGLSDSDVENALDKEVYYYLPEDNKMVVKSINTGAPFVYEYPTSTISGKLLKLTDKLVPTPKKNSKNLEGKFGLAYR